MSDKFKNIVSKIAKAPVGLTKFVLLNRRTNSKFYQAIQKISAYSISILFIFILIGTLIDDISDRFFSRNTQDIAILILAEDKNVEAKFKFLKELKGVKIRATESADEFARKCHKANIGIIIGEDLYKQIEKYNIFFPITQDYILYQNFINNKKLALHPNYATICNYNKGEVMEEENANTSIIIGITRNMIENPMLYVINQISQHCK